jgi:hypothetical protein
MRLIRNLTICREMNFYDKNTYFDKGKIELAHNTYSAPLYMALRSKVTFRPFFQQRIAVQKKILWIIIYAFSIEKIDFLIFSYGKIDRRLKKD